MNDRSAIQTRVAPPVPPAALAGFDHIQRTWDQSQGSFISRVLPGELYVSRNAEIVTTVLGSCIAACIYDAGQAIGGMNHFMLPDEHAGSRGASDLATRYGLNAMEQLINGIMKNGGCREDLKVKIFGGGRMIPTMGDVGARNIEFVRRYLREEGFEILSEDVGSVYPRKVNFHPTTGRAFVKRLRPLHKQALADREQELLSKISQKTAVSTDVELF